MPLTDAYLASCRTTILASAELTAFRAARAVTDSSTRAARRAAWYATYEPAAGGLSPAYNLRKMIRDIVNAQGDITGNITGLDRESAYRTFVSEFAPDLDRPATETQELAARKTILT